MARGERNIIVLSAWISLAFIVLLVVAVMVAARRALTLFELEILNGRLVRARGRIPQSLLHDFLGVCPRGLASRIIIRCQLERGLPRLVTKGPLGQDAVQQLRNLLGLWPLARLRAAPKVRN